VENRYLRLIAAALVTITLFLGAAACTIDLSLPTDIEEQIEDVTEALMTPEAPSPEATPAAPSPTSIPPSPTPEEVSTAYTNASLGFSIWYPEDWIYEEEVGEEGGEVTFATSQEFIEGGEVETGAGMMVMAYDLTGETIEDTFEFFASLLSDENVEVSDQESRTVGGQDGIIVTFEGTPEGSEAGVRGFLAGVEYEDWGYLFMGVSVLNEWDEHGADLQAILDSVRFTSRTQATPVPGEVFTPDSWEPDDTLADANLIEVGDTQPHDMHVEGDHDWVYFEAEEGATYVIETSNLGDDIDTVIYLYDQDENELAEDDDGGREPLSSRLYWTATEDGTLYAEIKDWGDNAGPGTEYDISLSLGEAFEADEYEPDDSLAQARRVAVGEAQAHNMHVAGDIDWVSFEAEEGTTYVIETSNLGDYIDTVIYLYDEDENELAEDDDGGDGWASRLEWTAAEDGTLYVKIEDWGSAAGPGTEYDISLSEM
jgi:hypothetical protein